MTVYQILAMFDLELVAPVSKEIADKVAGISYLDITAEKASIWKLSPAFSQMTWDFPVLDPARSNTILILAIPQDIQPCTIVQYVDRVSSHADFRFTMVRSVLNSAIIEFPSQKDADVFYINSLGEVFDPERPKVRCISLFLAHVSPDLIGITPVTRIDEEWKREFSLPMCPICFELFDPPISTLFHFTSLDDISDEAYRAWGAHKCLACASRNRPCDVCGGTNGLWICLECGHVGCGRDQNRHGLLHYEQTGHRFAFGYASHWLWDYTDDRGVSRHFRAWPVGTSEGVIDRYRQSLLENMIILMEQEEKYLMKTEEQNQTEISTLEAELLALETEEETLTGAYKQTVETKREQEQLADEIRKIRSGKEFADHDRLEKQKKQLEKRKEQLQAKMAELYKAYENRNDVSDKIFFN